MVAADAEQINLALEGDDPDCAVLIADGEIAVLDLGLEPWSRDEFNLGPDNAFVPCGYAESLGRILSEAAMSLSLDRSGDRIGAIEAAYRFLDYHDELPVGTGPGKWSTSMPEGAWTFGHSTRSIEGDRPRRQSRCGSFEPRLMP